MKFKEEIKNIGIFLGIALALSVILVLVILISFNAMS